MNTRPTTSFVQQHADPARGFSAVPRWWRETEFWQGLPGAHRAVLDELYHRMARVPLQRGTRISLSRGQWAMSWEQLAAASGVSIQQARAAVAKAVAEGIIQQVVVTFRTATSTTPRCLFTWVEFDSYDKPEAETNRSTDRTSDKSTNRLSNKTTNSSNTPLGRPQAENPNLNTPEENEKAATPPRGFAPAGADAPVPSSADSVPIEAAEGGAAGTPGASPASSRNVRKGRGGAAKGASPDPLSDQEKIDITTSLTALAGYYLHGCQGAKLPPVQWAALSPSPTNWAPVTRKYELPEPGVGVAALAGFAAFRINCARDTRRQRESLKLMNLPRLIGAVKNLLHSHHMTEAQVVNHIDRVGRYWQFMEIKLGEWGQRLALDETILEVPQVIAQAERVVAGSSASTAAPTQVSTELDADLQARINRVRL